MLAWMVEEKDNEPHVPVWDKTERKNESFSSNDFYWMKSRSGSCCRIAFAVYLGIHGALSRNTAGPGFY